MKTLSIGRLNYDINILLDTYPIEGNEITIKEMISCSGGSACTVAYALGKWNMESFISGVVGYDEIGNTMKKNMEENNVKTTYLETNYDIKTPTSYIMINKQNNSKTILKAELNQFNIKKFDYDQSMDCIIVDGNEYNASSFAFNKFNNAISILNAKKPHQGLTDYFKYAKYVVCSEEVAEKMMGLKIDFANPITMSNIYKKIIDRYPHINLLITMPGKGTIYSVNNEIKVLATMNSEIVDETGSDDIFVAMIAYGLTNGYDMETTIRLATIAEGMSKKTMGATLSTPILSDIISFYESRFGKLKNNNEPLVEEKTEQPPVPENIETGKNKEVSEELPKENNVPKTEQLMINPFAGTILQEEKKVEPTNVFPTMPEISQQIESNNDKDSNAPTT